MTRKKRDRALLEEADEYILIVKKEKAVKVSCYITESLMTMQHSLSRTLEKGYLRLMTGKKDFIK